MSLRLTPLSIKSADRFVDEHHRHSKPTHGKAKFALGAQRGDRLVGVAVCGRPKAGALDDATRLEIVRLCVVEDPAAARNVVSFLIGRCRRAAQALGYTEPLLTYIRCDEDGSSLTAAGFQCVAPVKAQSWDRPGRPRADQHELVPRERWEDAA